MRDNPTPHGGRWIELAPGNNDVTVSLERAAPDVTRGAIGIRFTTGDAEAAHTTLHAAGVDTDDILRQPGVPAMFAFCDPDGNTFSIQTGRVLATDIEVGWLADQARPGIEVKRHDIVHDDPPEGAFDLVHARLVLLHLPGRDQALQRMAAAVRPGGRLLVEDFDISLQTLVCPDDHGPDQHLANKIKNGFRALLIERGVDAQFGRRLPRLFRAAGLVDVAADAYFPLAGPGVAVLEHANIHQVKDKLISGGHASSQEVDTYLALVNSGRLDLATAPLVSTWGRRPPTPDRE